ncbi:hypothetical protein ACFQPA_10690 [Halomarina halobia]|uniref:Uncharacterized protein n=1 Tax=Halomarina halobia TaxID=3033386 RepID=A0ABD6AAJ7_9EURY|nr:hypothetical protein [Halomarina sp. PSR21]
MTALAIDPHRLGAALADARRRWIEWTLLEGDRAVVAAGVLAFVLAAVGAIELLDVATLSDRQPLYYLFSALLGGNLTLITVVISINQLLLSRELKSPGELRTEIDDVIEYRRDVERTAERDVAPVKPSEFLDFLLQNARRQAQVLGGLSVGVGAERAWWEISDLVTTITDRTDEIDRQLNGADDGIFGALSTTLRTNYAEQMHRARRIRAAYGDALPEETLEALDDTVERLQELDIARQYFKNLYLQDELSRLSRILLYAGIPAEVVAVGVLLAFTTPPDATTTASLDVVLPLAVTIGFAPLAILVSFILRTATVTQRTVATVPFTTPEQEV